MKGVLQVVLIVFGILAALFLSVGVSGTTFGPGAAGFVFVAFFVGACLYLLGKWMRWARGKD